MLGQPSGELGITTRPTLAPAAVPAGGIAKTPWARTIRGRVSKTATAPAVPASLTPAPAARAHMPPCPAAHPRACSAPRAQPAPRLAQPAAPPALSAPKGPSPTRGPIIALRAPLVPHPPQALPPWMPACARHALATTATPPTLRCLPALAEFASTPPQASITLGAGLAVHIRAQFHALGATSALLFTATALRVVVKMVMSALLDSPRKCAPPCSSPAQSVPRAPTAPLSPLTLQPRRAPWAPMAPPRACLPATAAACALLLRGPTAQLAPPPPWGHPAPQEARARGA